MVERNINLFLNHAKLQRTIGQKGQENQQKGIASKRIGEQQVKKTKPQDLYFSPIF